MPDSILSTAGSPYGGSARPDLANGSWSGVDTPLAACVSVAQGNLPYDDMAACHNALRDLTGRLRELGFASGFGAPGDRRTSLVGFSARLLKGTWTPWRDDADDSDRWHAPVRCPSSLRLMAAKRDDEFRSFADDDLRIGHETDVVVLIESDAMDLPAAAETLRPLLGDVRVHEGARRPGGRDPFGFRDGISNLQDLRITDPDRYEGHLLHREEDLGIDGSYLVFRRYTVFPERMRGLVTISDDRGDPARGFTPEQIIGRCRECGYVLDAGSGEHLHPEFDERQGARAFRQSHLYLANPRGHGTTNFGHHVVPPDVRMLRRSYPTTRPEGLLFLSFQADIQNGGFEFIHNEWLMSDFNGAPDPLLAPEAGLVEPTTGCYYFVPRRQDRVEEVFTALCAAGPRW